MDVRKLTDLFEAKYPGLGKFLTAIAHKESRFNPLAGGASSGNKARGLLGLRPKSALLELREGNRLLDPVESIARGIDYARRLQPKRWGATDYWSLARGWAFPYLTSDYGWSQRRSREVKGRVTNTLEKVDVTAADLDQLVPPLPTYEEALKIMADAGFVPKPVKTNGGSGGMIVAGLVLTLAIGTAVVVSQRRKKRR